MDIDTNLIPIISILAMALVAGIVAWRKDGIQAGATKSIQGIIGNETLSTSVEARLSAIPQDKRNAIIELVEMVTPLTNTSTISKDAAQWIQNMLDGKVETGAVATPLTEKLVETPMIDEPAIGGLVLEWLDKNWRLIPDLFIPRGELDKTDAPATVTTTTTVTAPYTAAHDETQLAGTNHTFFTPDDSDKASD